MLQKVNTVFVGKQLYAGTTIAGAYDQVNALAVGDIVAINPTTGGVIASADLVAAATFNEIQLGVVRSVGVKNNNAKIVKTQTINRNNIKSLTANGGAAFIAATPASALFTWTNHAIQIGARYVIRVIYKDIYEHPGQFTHTYEVLTVIGDTIDTLATKFADKINAHKGARVDAVAANGADTLTLTAKVIDGPEYGIATKEAITPYSQVAMKVVAYYTDPTSLLATAYNQIVGLTIAEVQSDPGKGNPFIIRDREQAALGYKGITYRTEWPVLKPELTVDLSKSYETVVVEFDKTYQSPDNQYAKSTGLAAEVYIANDGAGAGDGEILRDAIALWSGK